MGGGDEEAKAEAVPANPRPAKRLRTIGSAVSVAYAVSLAILGLVVLFILAGRSR